MKRIIFALLLIFPSALLSAQGVQVPEVNYDESKVGPYTLEDPLRFANGRRVRNAADWRLRRQEILDIFQSQMYGQMPPAPDELYLETIEEGVTLAGFGLRKQVRMRFRPDGTGPAIDWLVLRPRYAKGPVPTILLLNYYGNQTLLTDKEVLVCGSWLRNNEQMLIRDHHCCEESRGLLTGHDFISIFPFDMLLARGYAVVTACYGDVSPDPIRGNNPDVNPQDAAYTGVFELWGPRDPARTDNPTALGAWAWALMRGMDMVERDPALDQSRMVLTGCSRLGKAALIAGAFDERAAVVVPVQTGGGGVPLAKRNYGETISTEMVSFTHWYCKAYAKYAGNEDKMPFDQHLLLSCIAPRALLVEGFDKPWFDTKGEFLALQAASPVWPFLGRTGLPSVSWPDDYDTSAIGPWLGYVRRDQAHGIAACDWTWMLAFADRVFGL